MPITATRLPAASARGSSAPSGTSCPANVSMPSISGSFGSLSGPGPAISISAVSSPALGLDPPQLRALVPARGSDLVVESGCAGRCPARAQTAAGTPRSPAAASRSASSRGWARTRTSTGARGCRTGSPDRCSRARCRPTSPVRSSTTKSSIPACLSLIAVPSPAKPEPTIAMRWWECRGGGAHSREPIEGRFGVVERVDQRRALCLCAGAGAGGFTVTSAALLGASSTVSSSRVCGDTFGWMGARRSRRPRRRGRRAGCRRWRSARDRSGAGSVRGPSRRRHSAAARAAARPGVRRRRARPAPSGRGPRTKRPPGSVRSGRGALRPRRAAFGGMGVAGAPSAATVVGSGR